MIKEFYMYNPEGLKWYQKLWLHIIYPNNKMFSQNGDMKTEVLANLWAKGNKRKYIKYFNIFSQGKYPEFSNKLRKLFGIKDK